MLQTQFQEGKPEFSKENEKQKLMGELYTLLKRIKGT